MLKAWLKWAAVVVPVIVMNIVIGEVFIGDEPTESVETLFVLWCFVCGFASSLWAMNQWVIPEMEKGWYS